MNKLHDSLPAELWITGTNNLQVEKENFSIFYLEIMLDGSKTILTYPLVYSGVRFHFLFEIL